jgi:hypothetical protein
MSVRLLAAICLTASMLVPVLSREAAASEMSTAQRKGRVHKPAPAPNAVYRWRPADPSFDQHGRPYRPPPGLACPIDLGYGRWTSCTYR